MAGQLDDHGVYVIFMAFVAVLFLVLTVAALLESLWERRDRRR